MGWLRDRFFGKRGTAGRLGKLSNDVLTALQSRDFSLLPSVIKIWCETNKNPLNGSLIRLEAEKAGWQGRDLDKLEIIADYYSEQMAAAFEKSRAYINDTEFDPDLLIISTYALYRNNQYEDAYRFISGNVFYSQKIQQRADFWLLSALVCWAAADMDKLAISAKRMLELSPNDPVVLQNALGMFLELGDDQSFFKVRQAMELEKDHLGYSYALPLLAIGEYRDGFEWLEARYDHPEAKRYLNSALFGGTRWKGEPLDGRSLLLSAEQGLGDTIQMARYFRLLYERADCKLVIESQPESLSLLRFNFPEIPFVVREYGIAPAVSFDCWVATMSLPRLLGYMPEDIPGRKGYIIPPDDVSAYWSSRVQQLSNGKRLKVGIAWSGQPKHRGDRRRSIPFSKLMAKISNLDICFFALQTTVPEIVPSNLLSVADELITLSDTAALIAHMDLVITVDTSVVHLAGSLGKKTWLLLPYRYEWRWGLNGENNNWYDSVSVLRQSSHGDWDGLLNHVFEHLLTEYFGL